MTNELSKTISTCTIWLATALILTFGVFRMNGEFFFFFVITAMIAGAAVGATHIVWNSGKRLVGEVPFSDAASKG
jgi:hypothetical protein